ncbi:hypothetical protein [Peptacetobacter hiranonis]|uniref:Uncharacterized protein n=1 Tax=Peptacetobacter hiranonis (strain DSM 13275 / JCM 10541 / KCTC 15199 / TO-931) TaxID=500633 RepID=B6G015_PEPHT|nr:hypothetical protein [Peptacetobacter hiranonis]EEA84843.1 hypothetical protein CLOHIR_01469 [Peptacetobacter hiranonis DSM 13275]QEK20751.1 hypothetical protein KGNDJEFE_01238 [Peptacetobacter hiranonis]
MSLKDTINNTNTQKDNLKTVANNIDNKLIELGGEQATNLADVSEKIERMIVQYKKFAIIKPNVSLPSQNISFQQTVKVNLGFLPSIVFVEISPPPELAEKQYGDNVFSNLNSYHEGQHCRGEIASITKNAIKIDINPHWYGQSGSAKIKTIWAIE